MYRLLCLGIGYALGCVQSAYYVSKLYAKIDIREHGSGNAGTTNVLRVVGIGPGAATFLLDIIKTVLAYTICALLFNGDGSFFGYDSPYSVLPGIYGGLGTVFGHNFPIQLKFKGGKGVACTLAVMLCTDLRPSLLTYVVGIIVLALSMYISLTSLIMGILFPILLLAFGYSPEPVGLFTLLTFLMIYRHRENISRLIRGEENRLSVKRKKGSNQEKH